MGLGVDEGLGFWRRRGLEETFGSLESEGESDERIKIEINVYK